MRNKVTPADIQDIREYVVTHIEDYMSDYMRFGSYLPFADYVQTRISTQLAHKYNRYDVTEAFDSDKIQALLQFYLPEDDEETKITQH